MRIESKAQMYEQLLQGRFGNYPRLWMSLEAVEQSGFQGEISIRSLQTSNPVKLYHIPVPQLRAAVSKLPASHRDNGLTFSEAPPDQYRTLQGEYDGWNLYYTFAKAPMRLAFLQHAVQTEGLRARSLLKRYLDPGDAEWLEQLVDDFPGHVIEFSGFRIRCGQLNTRMLVWEVRHY